MNVFISSAGDGFVGEALRRLIKSVIQPVSVFLSGGMSIVPGVQWLSALLEAMDQSKLAVVCVTRRNVSSPWIMFEVGALMKSSIPIVPYLIDFSPIDLTGPLQNFRAVNADREGTLELLHGINTTLVAPVMEDILNKAFDQFWPELEATLKGPEIEAVLMAQENRGVVEESKTPSAGKQVRSEREMLEELLERVRRLEERSS